MRHSEASGLRWRQVDASAEPLGALNLERTKTQVPRRVPIHPRLAAVLEAWRTLQAGLMPTAAQRITGEPAPGAHPAFAPSACADDETCVVAPSPSDAKSS